MDDPTAPNWYDKFEKVSGTTRPAHEVRELLAMTECRPLKDNNGAVLKIREALKKKFKIRETRDGSLLKL